ncbi:MAG: TonB family protein [Bdellovibrionaceae bacterium]|nr:TonB family protein [Pseudobdellovibrionaceae bacterium]
MRLFTKGEVNVTFSKVFPKEIQAFLGSLCLHIGIFAIFIFPVAHEEKTVPVEVELITLSPGAPGESPLGLPAIRQPLAPKKTRISPTTTGPKAAGAPAAEEAPSATQGDLVGESDVESELQGRAPLNEKERYLAEIREQIAKRQSYPRSSRVFGEQGTVKLLLTIQRNGSLTKVEIIERSAFERLNTAAMTAATKAAPFRAFPNEVPFDLWRIALPVQFVLSQN